MTKLLLLLLGAGKAGKLLVSGGSMLLSVFAYALVYGWRYAAGFVVLIFCHEMGHYLAARRYGLRVGLPTFIPFVGAWVALEDQPRDARTEAHIGIAGPLLGTIAALACYGLARETDSKLLLALAYAGFFLNLFNLIPVAPLDGGRITAVLSPRVWLLGAPVLVAAFLWRPSPIFILIVLAAVPQLKTAWDYDPDAPASHAYQSASAEDKLTIGVFYIGLIVFLALMVYDLGAQLGPAR